MISEQCLMSCINSSALNSRTYAVYTGPCDDGAVRIISVGSARTFSGGGDIVGRVEICVGGMFGASICSDLWDNRDASVLCSQLGYSPYGG